MYSMFVHVLVYYMLGGGILMVVVSRICSITHVLNSLLSLRLTVTDADGAAAVATAKVTVLVDKDYPPIAHAGNPVVLHLPNNEATLDGSASKDEVGY